MTFCEISPESATAEISATRTAILTFHAPFETVFGYLADIENLPRWARGFCERLYLARGQWVALTSLGELFVGVESRSEGREIVLLAGWQPEELYRLNVVVASSEEGTRIKFALDGSADETHARIYQALEADFPELVSQVNERAGRAEVSCAA